MEYDGHQGAAGRPRRWPSDVPPIAMGGCAWFVWRLDFFYQEGFVNFGQFEGSAFWSLLAVLLTGARCSRPSLPCR